MSASARPIPTWNWLTYQKAAALAEGGQWQLEELRKGHGLLSRELFANALRVGDMEVLLLPGSFVALITWGECEAGLTMNVLTVAGSLEHAADAFTMLEQAARHAEAQQIISIGHPGWRKLVESLGYTTHTRLCMHKVLT